MTVPIWSFNAALNRKHSSPQLAGMKSCLFCRPKPLFYKWKPQRQLCLTAYGLAGWYRRSLLLMLLLSKCGFPQLRRDKQTKTNRKRDQKLEQTRGDNITKDTTTWVRVSRAVTPVSSRDAIMHINGGLVVNLGNTCAESKGSGAEKEVWHVQQLCGCRHCRALWSSVPRCDRALADSGPGAGWGWGWTGPYGLSESVRKGTCHGAKNNSTKCWNTSQKLLRQFSVYRLGQL